jgi:ADP-ribose pyrophosphatase YjhB (NUDIX family)
VFDSVPYEMIGETMKAHEQFSPPAVYMTVLVEDAVGGHLCLVDRRGPRRPSLFPCSFAFSCEQTAETLLAMYGIPRMAPNRKRIRLISDQSLFAHAYVYLFVVCVTRADLSRQWVPPDLELVSFLNCEHLPPTTPELLAHLSHYPSQEDLSLGPPPSFGAHDDHTRDEGTRMLKQENLCMPLITVNALLLQVDDGGYPIGAIFAKRAHSCTREGGKWYVPSGFVAGYESATQALARETLEEVNLVLADGDIQNLVFIPEPSPEERVWINWPLFYLVTTQQKPQEFWRGPNDEVERVAVFSLSSLPDPSEIAFGYGDLIRRGFARACRSPCR